MKKRVKRVWFALWTLVVVLVVAGIAAILLAGAAVDAAVESAGSKALTVPVAVGKAGLSVAAGAIELHDVTVENPPGYEGEKLLGLERADVQIVARTLLADPVHVKDMTLTGMEVFIEQKGLTGNNLYEVVQAIQDNRDPSGKRLLVDRLEIRDITVHAQLVPVPGGMDTVTLQLKPIEMTALGRDEPMDIAALTTKIILAVAAGIAKQGTDVLPKGMLGGLPTILDSAIDIGRIIFGIGEGPDNGGTGNTEGAKGILKRKQDE